MTKGRLLKIYKVLISEKVNFAKTLDSRRSLCPGGVQEWHLVVGINPIEFGQNKKVLISKSLFELIWVSIENLSFSSAFAACLLVVCLCFPAVCVCRTTVLSRLSFSRREISPSYSYCCFSPPESSFDSRTPSGLLL